MRYLFLVMLGFFGLLPAVSFSQTSPLQKQTIVFCSDATEWPPYTYFKRINGEQSEEVAGFDLELLQLILSKRQIPFRIDLIPWKRCLESVIDGDEYHVVLDASSNPEREKTYLLTNMVYTTTPYYFYAKSKFPQGVDIKKPADLTQHGMLCGIRGYTYIKFGVNNDSVDRRAIDFSVLKELTLAPDRCALALARFEAFSGFAKLGQDFLSDGQLGYRPIPGIEADKFYFLISRKYPTHKL